MFILFFCYGTILTQSTEMDCDQSQLKDIVRSALGEMLESKLASLLDKKLEPLYLTVIDKFRKKEFKDTKKERNAVFIKESNFLKQERSRMANVLIQMKATRR